MERIPFHHSNREMAKSRLDALRDALDDCGLAGNVSYTLGNVAASGGHLIVKNLRHSQKLKKQVKNLARNSYDAHDRLMSLLNRLYSSPYKGIDFFPIETVDANVICLGKRHDVHINKKGNLVTPHHSMEEIEQDRAMAVIADSRVGRCVRLYDAWQRGTLLEKDGATVQLPAPLRPAYRRIKQKMMYRVAAKQIITPADMFSRDLESRWYQKAYNAICNIIELETNYREILTGSNTWRVSNTQRLVQPRVPAFATNAHNYLHWRTVLPHQSDLMSLATLFDPNAVFNNMVDENATIRCITDTNKSWVPKPSGTQSYNISLAIFFKSIALWYATIYRKGLAVADNKCVLEVLDKDLISDIYEVKLIWPVFDLTRQTMSLELRKAIIQKKGTTCQILKLQSDESMLSQSKSQTQYIELNATTDFTILP